MEVGFLFVWLVDEVIKPEEANFTLLSGLSRSHGKARTSVNFSFLSLICFFNLSLERKSLVNELSYYACANFQGLHFLPTPIVGLPLSYILITGSLLHVPAHCICSWFNEILLREEKAVANFGAHSLVGGKLCRNGETNILSI